MLDELSAEKIGLAVRRNAGGPKIYRIKKKNIQLFRIIWIANHDRRKQCIVKTNFLT